MNEAVIGSGYSAETMARKLLSSAAKFWFGAAILGQWIFIAYVVVFYGGASLTGDFAKWNEVLPHGYIEGDVMGNIAVGVHLLLAVVILMAGTLQFIPQVRSATPKLHRWCGRLYVLTAIALSLGGIYMVLTRGVAGDNAVSIIINAMLIIVCGAIAWRHALKRDFARHKQWVVRLFLVVSGQWCLVFSCWLDVMVDDSSGTRWL